MVKQVRVVGVLMIVQGALECLLGLLYVASGPIVRSAIQRGDNPAFSGLPRTGALPFHVVMMLIGVAALAAGGIKIVGGVMALKFRSRMLAMVALLTSAISLLTCYCAPTAAAVLIYGLIVLLNVDVARAFETGGPPPAAGPPASGPFPPPPAAGA
jgi:hypothetical protein